MITLRKRDWSGKLYIDGLDGFLEYGVFVLDGEYKNIVKMDSFKKFEETEWSEYDGEECDLSAPVLSSVKVTLQFGITDVSLAEMFFRDLSGGAYHQFHFVELGKSYNLRMTQNNSFDSLYKLGKIKLTFSDDFPEVVQTEPYGINETEVTQSGYELDSVEFCRFGIWILEGSDDNIRKCAQVRPALSTDVRTRSGLAYDSQNVRFKTKDVTLKCLIKCGSIEEFWTRWNMLFTALTSPELKTFYFAGTDCEYTCYYKNCAAKTFKIMPNGRIWCEFDLTLCFTGEADVWLTLVDEAENYVVTEDSTEEDYTTISIKVDE